MSLGKNEFVEIGLSDSPSDRFRKIAEVFKKNGADGVFASPLEVAGLRHKFGKGYLKVTPGIRPSVAKETTRRGSPLHVER